MATEPFSRRAFLALTGSTALLAACGGSKHASSLTATTKKANDLATAVMSSDLYASPEPQRLAFIALTQNRRFASRAPATVAIKPPAGVLGPYTAAPLHRDGLPTDRGVYVVQPVLAKAGVYSATIKTAGQTIELPFQVQPKPQAPAVGAMAPTAASPTTTEPLTVKPLCTRRPACPLHSRSLGDLIGKGRPVAVMFATPALCQSAYCGPVLDTLLPLVTRFQDHIDFVHVEIYRDMKGTDVSPTVAAWNLSSEPWLFAVDPTGKIVARLDGAFASDEIESVLRQLTPA